MDYTFGMWGEYTVSGEGSFINVKETKNPINSLEPLYILIGVFIAIILAAFGGPHLIEWVKQKYYPNDAQSVTTYSSVAQSVNQVDEEQQRDVKEGSLLSSPPAAPANKKPARLSSLDTFRGLSLCLMIFVNYGGGGYWFFEHAEWNGLTFAGKKQTIQFSFVTAVHHIICVVADLLFPWFMWMMGVSMALSFASMLPKPSPSDPAEVGPRVQWAMWKHCLRRSAILFLLGMFIANGWEYTTWRVPGVLQYFAVSYLVTSMTVLSVYPYSKLGLQTIAPEDRMITASGLSSYFDWRAYPRILLAYKYEWVIQAAVVLVYLAVSLGGKAPGCPRGYLGPGGIAEGGNYEFCTGGIHRYIDMKAFGYKFIYHHPTCLEMYECRPYDPEGLLGSLSACTLTYLGLMAGRVVLHFKTHTERLSRFAAWAFGLLLLTGILCGFVQNGGPMPVNKNLWSTSFVTMAAGSGLIGLSTCYVLVDLLKVWSGAPFLYLGMNSILIYVSHGILQGYMPFSYKIYHINHATLLQCHVLGVTAWAIVAYYFFKIKFFVKI